MKKHTIILIIMCLVSLVTGVIFSVAGLVSLRRAGMEWVRDAWEDSEFVWHFDEDSFEEGEIVRVRVPFVDVYVVDGHVQVSVPGVEVDVSEGRSSVRIGSFKMGDEILEADETIAKGESENNDPE